MVDQLTRLKDKVEGLRAGAKAAPLDESESMGEYWLVAVPPGENPEPSEGQIRHSSITA